MAPQESPIETPRLLLLTVTEDTLAADREGKGLSDLLGLAVPATWPPEFWEPGAIEYLCRRVEQTPHYLGWCRYIALKQLAGAPVLIGGCGATESPESLQEVEIGYSLLNEFRGHGYATEALNGLIPWIFKHSMVYAVRAQTYPHLAASIAVLRRSGFILDGTGRDPGTILFRRMRAMED
jgi:[ribosomal protein S5]-alanine N-acetyltransferase